MNTNGFQKRWRSWEWGSWKRTRSGSHRVVYGIHGLGYKKLVVCFFLYLQRSHFVHDYAVFMFMYTHPRSYTDQKLHFFHT